MSRLWVKFENYSSVKVSTENCEDVDDFLEVCKKKLSPILDSYSPAQLFLTDGSERTLEPDEQIPVGNTARTPFLINIIANFAFSSRTSSSSSLSLKPPHPTRKRRWERLNEILDKNPKAIKTNSVGYSYISWKHVQDVLDTTPYEQEEKEFPKDILNFLYEYIAIVRTSFGSITTGREAKRLHFIAPVLTTVAYLFTGEVQIIAEEDLDGVFVRAHGHFEFVLHRHNKYVCIVEAKREDMEQGKAQDLVGCEVAAEIGELDCVYGIVTDYMRWVFFRSLNEKIEEDVCSLEFNHGVASKESLKKIVGKIYAILSGVE